MKTVPKPSAHPTASRATYTSVSLVVFIAAMLTLLLSACSSTSIEEPNPPASADADDLVVTFSTPNAYIFPSSRADEEGIHAGHDLRYTAILYKSLTGTTQEGINGTANQVQRIEQLSKNGNKIVFRSIPEGNYFIVAFADYVDENAKPTDGHYPDKYYDTMSSPNYITLLPQDDEKQYFNNHNYDFFLYTIKSFEKKKNHPQEFNITLKRHVSQVQVAATSNGSIDALDQIKIKNWFVFDKMDLISGTASESKDMPKKNVYIDAANRTSKLLFFFYTFNVSETGSMLGTTRFELMNKDGYGFTKAEHTLQSLIRPLPNLIYKVQGDFLSTSKVPSKVVDIKVTADENWDNESQTLPD